MHLHLIGFPHTRITREFSHCAYSMKCLKMAKMLGDQHQITLYATEGSDAPGAEVVQVLSDAERVGLFGADDHNRLPAWPNDDQWRLFNQRTIAALLDRLEAHDLILLTAGLSQRTIADVFPTHISCEPGVGYEGVFLPYRAYESYAWMHHIYAKYGVADGRWYDAVIPNYFDPDEFPLVNKGGGEYLLFVGRLVARKGLTAAADVATAAGLPLYVAGAGATHVSEGEIVTPEVTIRGDVHHLGPVGVEQRAELMAGARALLAPTTYIEPFGGVAVEAMLCGTPAITTDWGAFVETVPVEWRFHTLQEGVDAVERAADADHAALREYALERYSLDAVAPQFNRWFDQLQGLWDDGWYNLRREVVAAA